MHCAIATNAFLSSRLYSQRLDDTPPPACSKRLRSQLVEGTTLSLQNKGCKISVNLVKTFRCTDSNSLQTLNFQSKSQKCARSFLPLLSPLLLSGSEIVHFEEKSNSRKFERKRKILKNSFIGVIYKIVYFCVQRLQIFISLKVFSLNGLFKEFTQLHKPSL